MASEVACENGAPDESQRSTKICEENGTSLNARKCSVCGTPVKGHFGHCGQSKWGGPCEKVHNVHSRKVEKTAIKIMTCHKYASKRVSQKVP